MQPAIEEHNCGQRMGEAVSKSAFAFEISGGGDNSVELPEVERDRGPAEAGCEQKTVVFVSVYMKENGRSMMPVG